MMTIEEMDRKLEEIDRELAFLERKLRRLDWIQWMIPRVWASMMAVLLMLIVEGWVK